MLWNNFDINHRQSQLVFRGDPHYWQCNEYTPTMICWRLWAVVNSDASQFSSFILFGLKLQNKVLPFSFSLLSCDQHFEANNWSERYFRSWWLYIYCNFFLGKLCNLFFFYHVMLHMKSNFLLGNRFFLRAAFLLLCKELYFFVLNY